MPTRKKISIFLAFLLLVMSAALSGLEPPTPEQIQKYRLDGSYAARVAAAREIGNHRMDPEVVAHLNYRVKRLALEAQGYSPQQIDRLLAPPPSRRGMPTRGQVKVLAILIAFQDYAPITSADFIAQKLFGTEDVYDPTYPYETMRAYYSRASYSQLDIQGNVLGWYTTAYNRSQVEETTQGRQTLIKEVLNYYDSQGHDFSQYDNDNDGYVDYFLVFWTGPHGEWASFWWGYQTTFSDTSYVLDGKRLRRYSWQWELYNYPYGQFTPQVAIHETGHALGLPDYYDYDASVGPKGGLGGFDMMDASVYDHNAFSKFVLDWLTPAVFSSGSQVYTLRASGDYPEALIFFPGAVSGDIFNEYFLVQNRYATRNDSRLVSINGGDVGLAVWHVDARLNSYGTNFLYDNSYTEHKLLRLVQADGLDEIELGLRGFDSADFYRLGAVFGPSTYPATVRYDGTPTEMSLLVESGTGPVYSVSMTAAANPVLRLSSSALNFGQVNICTRSDLAITVYNDGGGPLLINSISRVSGPSDFTCQASPFPLVIPAGSSREVTFRFDAYNTGPLTSTFAINSNDPATPQALLTLTGTGFIPEINLNIQVERRVERGWILRRSYARITIQVSKAAPFDVDSYRLTRQPAGGGSTPQIVQTFSDADFSSGQVVNIDKYLEADQNYLYTIQALDCYGRVIVASSEEKTGLDRLRERILKTINK
ncbi:MAG: M6 family metalloprotease domain-containing protein [Candidatus Saccharicenans sp.]|jgi:M6 family metalloprotease-like protein|nr:M6 family metalloprotease domain-containing protein [Candidatus Saccharicenans sp.]